MRRPVIVVGGGGHAKVVIESLLSTGHEVLGYTDVKPEGKAAMLGVSCLGNDERIFDYSPSKVWLANGIGSISIPLLRRSIFQEFSSKGYVFPSIVHQHAIVSAYAVLEDGVQVMAGAVVQPGCVIGTNSIINTRASVDHDCMIGEHVHIAPGVTLSGEVRVAMGVHIGTGATIIQGVSIGAESAIAAGAVVVSNIAERSLVKGVPARRCAD
jgi:sugar O-acyltransferase (sialic acid O-acetyltransferase NeuD family)